MRRLTLKKESLAELRTDELSSVVGAGTHLTCQTGLTYCGICEIQVVTIESVNKPCPTV